jgi:hypothetical protein
MACESRSDLFVRCVASLDFRLSGVVVFSNDRKYRNLEEEISVWKIGIRSDFHPPCRDELLEHFSEVEFLNERILRVTGNSLKPEMMQRMFPGAFKFRRERIGVFSLENVVCK